MFKTRLLSGIVLVILALVMIIGGGNILLFSTLAISLVGMYELYRVFQIEKSILAIISYIIAVLYYCNLNSMYLLMLFLFLIFSNIFFYLFVNCLWDSLLLLF